MRLAVAWSGQVLHTHCIRHIYISGHSLSRHASSRQLSLVPPLYHEHAARACAVTIRACANTEKQLKSCQQMLGIRIQRSQNRPPSALSQQECIQDDGETLCYQHSCVLYQVRCCVESSFGICQACAGTAFGRDRGCALFLRKSVTGCAHYSAVLCADKHS